MRTLRTGRAGGVANLTPGRGAEGGRGRAVSASIHAETTADMALMTLPLGRSAGALHSRLRTATRFARAMERIASTAR
jgi:hypothetical protein